MKRKDGIFVDDYQEPDAKRRIIVALDVDSVDKAIDLVKQLSAHVGYFKIGFQLIYAMLASIITAKSGSKAADNAMKIRFLFQLIEGKAFIDAKLHDIPNTVAGASKEIGKIGAKMFNLHCQGGKEMMVAAKKAAEAMPAGTGRTPVSIFGVTLLTSLNYDDLVELGIFPSLGIKDDEELKRVQKNYLNRYISNLAILAGESGLDGVIASPQEIEIIRRNCGNDIIIVTPGVRPSWAAKGDQKRVMTPKEAILKGADMVVVGRPITDPPPEIGTPRDAAILIAEEIEMALQEK